MARRPLTKGRIFLSMPKEGSRRRRVRGIPFLQSADLFPPKGAPRSIGEKAGDPSRAVLFDNGHWFHDQQVEIHIRGRPALERLSAGHGRRFAASACSESSRAASPSRSA